MAAGGPIKGAGALSGTAFIVGVYALLFLWILGLNNDVYVLIARGMGLGFYDQNIIKFVLSLMILIIPATMTGAKLLSSVAPDSGEIVPAKFARLILYGFALSGFTALAYEVIWSRVLTLILTGTTFGTLSQFDVDGVDNVEIARTVTHGAPYFKSENSDVLNNPKSNIIIDDGRSYLEVTNKKYDVITEEPMHPALVGVVNLYTKRSTTSLRKATLERVG